MYRSLLLCAAEPAQVMGSKSWQAATSGAAKHFQNAAKRSPHSGLRVHFALPTAVGITLANYLARACDALPGSEGPRFRVLFSPPTKQSELAAPTEHMRGSGGH